LDKYEFPKITEEDRKLMKWGTSGKGEPPVTMKDAVVQHKGIWQKMHAKILKKRASLKAKSRRESNARKQKEKRRLAHEARRVKAVASKKAPLAQ